VRIAAIKLDEAPDCLRWHEPDFEIDSAHNLGIILYGFRLTCRLRGYTPDGQDEQQDQET
jgi:hypothetical protein